MGGELRFKVDNSSSGDLLSEFVDAKGFPSSINNLKKWDDIVFNTADFEVYEGDDLINIVFIGVSGKDKRKYNIPKVSGFDYEITADNKAKKEDVESIQSKLIKEIDDTITINKDYDLEKAECSIKNGVLLIVIPKKEDTLAKKLQIKLLK